MVECRGRIARTVANGKITEQERTIELGLIAPDELKRRRTFAYVLILAWMIIVLTKYC